MSEIAKYRDLSKELQSRLNSQAKELDVHRQLEALLRKRLNVTDGHSAKLIEAEIFFQLDKLADVRGEPRDQAWKRLI